MTELEFQKYMIQAVTGIRAEVTALNRSATEVKQAVGRLESAVLGAPEAGAEGLLARMLVTEEQVDQIRNLTPSKKKNLAITSVAGVIGSLLTLLAALAKDIK